MCTDILKYGYVLIRYRDESLPLIGMNNSCHGNCNLDTERVTGSVDNSQSYGDWGEEMEDETVSQRREGSDKPTGVFLHGAMWKRAVKHSPERGGHMMHANLMLRTKTRHKHTSPVTLRVSRNRRVCSFPFVFALCGLRLGECLSFSSNIGAALESKCVGFSQRFAFPSPLYMVCFGLLPNM